LRHTCASPGTEESGGLAPEEYAAQRDAPAYGVRQGIMRSSDRVWKPVLAEVGRAATPEFEAQLAARRQRSERDLFEVFPWPRPGIDDT